MLMRIVGMTGDEVIVQTNIKGLWIQNRIKYSAFF